MGVIKKDNKFVSYLIILASLFILFLFTVNQYTLLQENLDVNTELQNEIKEKRDQIAKNDEIKAKIKEDTNITQKYLVSINEDEIIDYIYSYIEDNDSDESRIDVKNISFSEGIKNELGFTETSINLTVKVSNEQTMNRLLDFFTSNESKYNFFIDKFTYPNDGRGGSYNIDVPLKIFYK